MPSSGQASFGDIADRLRKACLVEGRVAVGAKPVRAKGGSGLAAAILLLMLAVPSLASTTYDIVFTTTGGSPAPASGSFTYDSVTGFSAFMVTWDGSTINLMVGANAPDTGTHCTSEGATPAFGFIIMSETATGCGFSPSYQWTAAANGTDAIFNFVLFAGGGDDIIQGEVASSAAGPGAQGTWTIWAVPEPGTFPLAVCALASVAVWRRRQRRRKAAK